MTREIKFRGLDSLTGKWVYGSLVQVSKYGSMAISTLDENGHLKLTEIDRDTASQNTGLKDRNSKEIFEGDIVEREVFAFDKTAVFIGKVTMFEGCWWIDTESAAVLLWNEMHELKVIGNIYENPELLEEK